MARVIRFQTALFDVSLERENRIHPIRGESLLLWLQETVRPTLVVTDPDAEDWGWSSLVVWEGRHYLLGARATGAETGEPEWLLQVDKQRSLKERFLGRATMTSGDPCARHFQDVLEREPRVQIVAIETDD